MSAFPATSLVIGFLLVLFGSDSGVQQMIQGGWGFITVGVIVELVLPISRRLR